MARSLSIITVTHQSSAVLPQFVRAAAAAAPHSEIVIVDNASTDGGPNLVSAHPQVTVLANNTNVGFGRACNIGARYAAKGILAFVNPDLWLSQVDVPPPGDFKPFGIAAGVMSDERGDPVSAISREPRRAAAWYREVFSPLAPRQLPPLRRRSQRRPGYVSGALCLVEAGEFQALGGFDERFFLYHEDRDLGRRYRRAGLPVRHLTSVRGRHLHGSSTGATTTVPGQAWSIVSWIEYVGIWEGSTAARNLADRVLRRLSNMGTLLSESRALVRSQRVSRKAAEYRQLHERVSAFPRYLPPEVPGFYPHARAAILP